MILVEQTILGMDKTIFIILVSMLGIVFIGAVFFYLAIVFVKSGKVKIVERLGKYKKTIYSPKGFIIPLLDKVVCELDMGLLVFDSKSPITILGADNTFYKINYGLSYFIVDPSKYYNETKDKIDILEDIFSKIIIEFYNSKLIKSPKEIYDSNNDLLIEYLCSRLIKFYIKIDDFVIRTIEKE